MRRIEEWTERCLIFLAVGAFILSFSGMYYVAYDAGYGLVLSFLWPLVTESAVIIFSLILLISKLKNYENRIIHWVILGFTGMSVIFNVWHAPNSLLLTKLVVGLPPIMLYAAFKTWIWKVEKDETKRSKDERALTETEAKLIQRQTETKTEEEKLIQRQTEIIKLETEISKLETEAIQRRTEISELISKVKELQSKANSSETETIQSQTETKLVQAYQIDGWIAAGGTQAEIAKRLGLTDTTIRNRLKMLNGSRLS